MALGLNDVDVDGMKELDRKIRENPALGKRTVKLRSTWQRGVKALIEIGAQEVLGKPATPPTRRFFVAMDAPAGLGGVDAGPTAAESLVAALAGCLTSGIAANAALFECRSSSSGDGFRIAFRGLLGTTGRAQRLTDIRDTVTVQSPPPRNGAALQETIDRNSPLAILSGR